jgi:hypothetical protein
MNQFTKSLYDLASKRVVYNPKTGAFIWKETRNMHNKAGHKAGFKAHFFSFDLDDDDFTKKPEDGYRVIPIRKDGQLYVLRADRLAWYVSRGEIPKEIAHVNGKKDDNRLRNLARGDS